MSDEAGNDSMRLDLCCNNLETLRYYYLIVATAAIILNINRLLGVKPARGEQECRSCLWVENSS